MGRLQALSDMLYELASLETTASSSSSGNSHATPPSSSSPPAFLRLPLELRDIVFTHYLPSLDPDAWDWAAPSTHLKDALVLSATRMRPPALAHVNRQLRMEILTLLFRTKTFRVDLEPHSAVRAIDQRVRLRERMQGMSWFGLLDHRARCGIRRLQLRLPVSDSRGRCATLNLAYAMQPDRWEVELVVDQGFSDEEAQSQPRSMPPKPLDFEVGVLKTLLEKDTRHRGDDIQGLDWTAVARLMRVVDLWYILNERAFQYREFQATVLVPQSVRRRNGGADGRIGVEADSEGRSTA